MAAAMLSVGVYVPAYAEEAGEAEKHIEDVQTEAVIAAAGFTELDDTVLTADQIESKMNLSAHIEELEDCEAGDDYVPNEIIVEAEDDLIISFLIENCCIQIRSISMADNIFC